MSHLCKLFLLFWVSGWHLFERYSIAVLWNAWNEEEEKKQNKKFKKKKWNKKESYYKCENKRNNITHEKLSIK